MMDAIEEKTGSVPVILSSVKPVSGTAGTACGAEEIIFECLKLIFIDG